MNPAEEDPERYAAARDEIMRLIQDGSAIALLNTWAEHNTSCHYVWSILFDVANDSGTGVEQSVKNFAANLMDDWTK